MIGWDKTWHITTGGLEIGVRAREDRVLIFSWPTFSSPLQAIRSYWVVCSSISHQKLGRGWLLFLDVIEL